MSPQPEDYTITPVGPLGTRLSVDVVEHGHVCIVSDAKEALRVIGQRMERERFWPDVWFIDDDDGALLLST